MATLESTSAVVLAAGSSRRYGASNKLLGEFQGKPLAQHVADTLSGLPFQQRIAVCPRIDHPLSELFSGCGFDIALNAKYERGQASSLAAGVDLAVEGDPSAILICLADMPLVSAALVKELVEALDVNDPIGVVASVGSCAGVVGPPAVFAPVHFRSLMGLQGDAGARSLLRAARTVRVSDESLRDVDTPDDFISLRLS